MNGFESVLIHEINYLDNRKWSVFFTIPRSSPYFREHFESFHLLPAVAEVDIVACCVEKILGKEISVLGIKKTKYTKPIFPDERGKLVLDLSKSGSINFSFFNQMDTKISFGNMEYKV